MPPLVLVTFNAEEQERRIIAEVLTDTARVSFLADFAEDARADILGEAEVLISGSAREVSQDKYDYVRRVRLIQTLPAGVDRVPFESLPSDIVVASNAGAFAGPMAEHVMAMILALAKNLFTENQKLRHGEFDRGTQSRPLSGLTAGIVGFGGIGRATARLMRPFGVRILALNRSGRSSEAADFVGTLADVDRVLAQADVVVLSIPLTRTTEGLLDARRLGLMKEDAILVNVARGRLIDQHALYEHCREHPGFLVGLDVWWGEPFRDGKFRTEYPLLELPNLIGSPHNSGRVPGIMAEATRLAAENVRRFLQGEEITGVVSREDYLGDQA